MACIFFCSKRPSSYPTCASEIDASELLLDPHGLKVLNRKLALKLGQPAQMASYTAVVGLQIETHTKNTAFSAETNGFITCVDEGPCQGWH